MAANKENLRKWVKALRSGEYRQGEGSLRTNRDEFCCLGVACDISGLGEWEGTNNRHWNPIYTIGPEVRRGTALPHAVRDWLGVEDSDPMFQAEDDDWLTSASQLNDELHYTFEQIADAIERTHEL